VSIWHSNRLSTSAPRRSYPTSCFVIQLATINVYPRRAASRNDNS
jgi:hypothetical protein